MWKGACLIIIFPSSDDTPAKWMTEGDKEALFRAGVKFMDITDYPNPVVSTLNSAWTPCMA